MDSQSPTHRDLPHWLALLRAPRVGPVAFARLLEYAGRPGLLFEPGFADALDLPGPLRDYLRNPDWAAVERDLAWADQPGHHIITLADATYPALLRCIADAPPLLFVNGNPAVLGTRQLAVVGSRNPSRGGMDTARAFAASLTRAGLVVTSGLALGIDAAAHRGALAAGGPTIAVTGCGPDRVYPARHRSLATEISGHGAIITELPTGCAPAPAHFPRRNRIISGLSLGTLVVEAALRSGSLITARHALDQGREVFALPGSIQNPLARGCHQLIRDGAVLVETVADALAELAPLAGAHAEATAQVSDTNEIFADAREARVVESLGYEPTPVDVVVRRSGLTAEEVCSILLTLELRGHVSACPGGAYSRAPR